MERAGLLVAARDTSAGLLVGRLASPGSTGADLLLLDPRTGQPRRRIATGRIVVATGDTVVAHLPAGCGLDCPLTVTDLTGGRSRDYPTPDPGPPATGRFSPDGRRLALAVPGHYFSAQRSVRPGFVAVLDLATGAVVRVPGVETPAARTADVDWAPTVRRVERVPLPPRNVQRRERKGAGVIGWRGLSVVNAPLPAGRTAMSSQRSAAENAFPPKLSCAVNSPSVTSTAGTFSGLPMGLPPLTAPKRVNWKS